MNNAPRGEYGKKNLIVEYPEVDDYAYNDGKITKRAIAKLKELKASNKLLTPIQIYFHSRLDSIELRSFLLMPKEEISLVKYKGKIADSLYPKYFMDSVRISYYWGHKSLIKPDLDYAYRLPFKKGKEYQISQSFNGKFSHNDKKSK